MDNINKFDYCVGAIFSSLLEKFPCRDNVDLVKIWGGSECKPIQNNSGYHSGDYLIDGVEVNLTENIFFAFETLTWLKETGYLIGTVSRSTSGFESYVTLSPKALEILKAMPDSIDSSKSIGEKLLEATKDKASETIAELGGQALSYFFKYGISAIQSQLFNP